MAIPLTVSTFPYYGTAVLSFVYLCPTWSCNLYSGTPYLWIISPLLSQIPGVCVCVCVRVCISTLPVDNFHTFEPNSQSVCVYKHLICEQSSHFWAKLLGGGGQSGGGGGNGRSVLAGGDSQGKDALQQAAGRMTCSAWRAAYVQKTGEPMRGTYTKMKTGPKAGWSMRRCVRFIQAQPQ